MDKLNNRNIGYLLAVALGALAGSSIAIILSQAIPKMMNQMMSGMMQNMMAQMKASGCTPSEM
jgi:hypothetical protein